jgi:hypothetical protein
VRRAGLMPGPHSTSQPTKLIIRPATSFAAVGVVQVGMAERALVHRGDAVGAQAFFLELHAVGGAHVQTRAAAGAGAEEPRARLAERGPHVFAHLVAAGPDVRSQRGQ